jgi:hypothetical protein
MDRICKSLATCPTKWEYGHSEDFHYSATELAALKKHEEKMQYQKESEVPKFPDTHVIMACLVKKNSPNALYGTEEHAMACKTALAEVSQARGMCVMYN